jgi:hypothetical protein
VQLLLSIFIGWTILLSRVKADYYRAGLQASCGRNSADKCISIVTYRHPTTLPRKGYDSMKPVTIIGILLILVGIIGFATGGISFTHQKKVADLGSVQISRKTQDTLPLSPIFSTVSLIVGLGLVVVGARSK